MAYTNYLDDLENNRHIHTPRLVLGKHNCLWLVVKYKTYERLPAIFDSSLRIGTCSKPSPWPILIVRLLTTNKINLLRWPAMFRLDYSKKHHKAVEDMCTTAAILTGILTMLEDRRSPPHNRFCSCDCSQSLRLDVRSSNIACDYHSRLFLYRWQSGRKWS